MSELRASVIIPAHNRKTQLELSLLSLEKQDCSKDKYEVIVIDDGSADGTYDMLNSLNTVCNLKLIRNEQNLGAATARNMGVAAAEGDIIIFSDSDCIVPPNFIDGHLKYHESSSDLAVCAVISWIKVFSVYYESFNGIQKNEFNDLRSINVEFSNRLDVLGFNYQNNTRILFDDDIGRITSFSYIPSWSDYFLGNVIKTYGVGLRGFEYPWVLFGTGNSSIYKKHIIAAGWFDESLNREEDWDLGYRLHKSGIKFIGAKELESIHQEHGIAKDLQHLTIESYKIIFNKYKEFEMRLFCLFNEEVTDLITLSKAVSEYKKLIEEERDNDKLIDALNKLLDYRVSAYLQRKQKTKRYMKADSEVNKFITANRGLIYLPQIIREMHRLYI